MPHRAETHLGKADSESKMSFLVVAKLKGCKSVKMGENVKLKNSCLATWYE
jgi:hypothetical protein